MGLSCSCSKKQVDQVHGEYVFRSAVKRPEGLYGTGHQPHLKEICVHNVCKAVVDGEVLNLRDVFRELPCELKESMISVFVETNTLTLDLFSEFADSGVSGISLHSGLPVTDEWLEHLPFKSLERLDLAGCFDVTDKGMEAIGRGDHITHLSLKQCLSVTSNGLLSLSKLVKLRQLDLTASKQITSRGLEALENMTKLTVLRLDRCPEMTDEGLLTLRHLSSLQELSVANCFQLTDRGLSVLASFPLLRKLDISRTGATNATIRTISELKGLTVLRLAGTDIDDDAGAVINGLHKLKTLDVESCSLRDPFINSLKDAGSLIELNLAHTRVSDSGVSTLISRCLKLRVLNLDSCNIGDFAVEHMFKLRNLRSLDLSDTSTSSSGLTGIAGCVELRRLVLTCTNVSNHGLKYLSKLEKLEVLGLDSRNISDEGLLHVSALGNLKELDLFGARISDTGIKYISNLQNLESLEVCSGGLTNTALDYLCGLKSLKSLNISQNHKITNAGVAKLSALPCLKSLNLGHTRINDGVTHSVRELANLKTLSIQGCVLSRSAQMRLRSNLTVLLVGGSVELQVS